MKTEARAYTIGEEITHSITHGIGVLAAVAGLVLLTLKEGGYLGGQRSSGIAIIAVLLFTFTMIGMYLMSTLYHAIQHKAAKDVFRKLDRSAIFVFIAGTYTPYCLICLGGALGWSLLTFEWTMAIFGITCNWIESKKFKKFEIAAYLMMGWAIVIGIVPLIRTIPVLSLILLGAGGIAYTLGVIWYKMEKVKNAHIVWHIFVIIGTVCHWFSIWYIN